MKKYLYLVAALSLLAVPAFAAGFDKALKFLTPTDLATLSASSLDSSADYFYAYDASATNIVKVLIPDVLTGTVPSGITNTYAAGSTLSIAGTLTSTGAATFTAATPTALVGPPPTAGGASITITAAKAGQVFKLDTAAGTTATLPAATGTGNHYYFVVSTAATSNAHKILAASSSDNIIGEAVGQNANTAKVFPATVASTYHSIQMPFSGSQPSGGFQGDTFEFIDIGTNLWMCRGLYTAGTTPTTPFSTATS